MAEMGEENKMQGVFGGVEYEGSFKEVGNIEEIKTTDETVTGGTESSVFQRVEAGALPTKQTVWSKIRSFLFQEIDLMAPIKVELTPYQQKIEDEINEFLHQEISFKGIFNIFKKTK